jgi:aspartate kinase
MFGTLADAKVNIQMISTSEIRITCIVAQADADRALKALHDAFDLAAPDPVDAESRA